MDDFHALLYPMNAGPEEIEKDPEHLRAEAFETNEGDWEEQMKNIAAHVSASF